MEMEIEVDDQFTNNLVEKELSLPEALEVELQKILKKFTELENRVDDIEEQVVDTSDLEQKVEDIETELEDLKDTLRNV